MPFELHQPPILITDEPAVVDLEFVGRLLATSYWAADRPREITIAAWRSPAAIPFTAILDRKPVGFARVVTDRLTFAWLANVMVDPTARGRGIGKLLAKAVAQHPDLQGHVRMVLATRDAHGIYEPVGFVRRELMWKNAPASGDPQRS